MRDCQKSTAPAATAPPPEPAPPRFNADEALRETFARQLRPEDRHTLAALCDAVVELTSEAPIYADRYVFNGVRDEASAVAAELRYAAAYLNWSAHEAGIDTLSRAEHRLADLGVWIAEQLVDHAVRLEKAASAAAEIEN